VCSHVIVLHALLLHSSLLCHHLLLSELLLLPHDLLLLQHSLLLHHLHLALLLLLSHHSRLLLLGSNLCRIRCHHLRSYGSLVRNHCSHLLLLDHRLLHHGGLLESLSLHSVGHHLLLALHHHGLLLLDHLLTHHVLLHHIGLHGLIGLSVSHLTHLVLHRVGLHLLEGTLLADHVLLLLEHLKGRVVSVLLGLGDLKLKKSELASFDGERVLLVVVGAKCECEVLVALLSFESRVLVDPSVDETSDRGNDAENCNAGSGVHAILCLLTEQLLVSSSHLTLA